MLLKELMEDAAKLKQLLKRKEKLKYLSTAITNEVLNDFSHSVLTRLQQDIWKAKYFAIGRIR